MRGSNVRDSQDRNTWVKGRLAAQLDAPTVRSPHKRFFGGPLALLAAPVAPANTLQQQRVLLQSHQVSKELSLQKIFAGPGTIR